MGNINTAEYWDNRFKTGDWEQRSGRTQTTSFAYEYVRLLQIECNFTGTILDFGCGLGDAIPVYKKHFPLARFIGVDHSESGIGLCNEKYGAIAQFINGSVNAVPPVDVIIASNVFEHLTDDKQVACQLAEKCERLFIIVPYRQTIDEMQAGEHINSYHEQSFDGIGIKVVRTKVFCSSALAMKTRFRFMWYRIWQIWVKNIVRVMLNRKRGYTPREILFEIRGLDFAKKEEIDFA